MGKSKEEDGIEKLIRGLLKLPENRRCINCNSLGPQYVCTTFWTFVCTNCSGVHREFTHRVKSVSMAKFTSDEVSALQAGGNEWAREIYFKTWDQHRHFFPDNRNIHKLRDFIKHVYVDRRFTGESYPALAPRLRKSEKDELYESRNVGNGEKSYFHERTTDKYSRYSYDEGRSPRYPRENSRYGGSRYWSSRFEGTDGRYQVDDARIVGRSATQMFTTEDIKPRRSRDMNSPPPVRHVTEILGEKFLPLRVGEHSKSSGRRSVNIAANEQKIGDHSKASNRRVDGRAHGHGQEGHVQQSGDHSKTNHRRSVSAYTQSNMQPGSQISANNDALKPKSGSAGSLVNFATFPPPDASIQEQAQEMHVTKDGGSSDSSNPSTKEIVCSAPPKNTLEFWLFELSTPTDITPRDGVPSTDNVASHTPFSKPSTLPHSSPTLPLQDPGLSEPATLEMVLTLPSNSGDDNVSTMEEDDQKQSPSIQQPEQSTTPVSDSSSSVPQAYHSDQVISNQPEALSLVPSENPLTARSGGRTELPADLFASLYPSGPSCPMPVPGWQMRPSYGMGFNMQYHPASMQIPAFLNVGKSRNPFDTNHDTAQHNATMFPLTTALQGGLANVSAPLGILHTSGYGSHVSGFPPTQSPSYSSGAYMGQHLYNNMPSSRQQGVGSFGNEGGMPGSLNLNQQNPYTYPAPSNPSSFPTGGGNPFG